MHSRLSVRYIALILACAVLICMIGMNVSAETVNAVTDENSVAFLSGRCGSEFCYGDGAKDTVMIPNDGT